mmetsp:Transcript_23964/g.27427  ORF Transcript_23964/g.27427 Transcript_23964/m.27427 type:complete len:88 (+) Transcript_23964:49-312(+)
MGRNRHCQERILKRGKNGVNAVEKKQDGPNQEEHQVTPICKTKPNQRWSGNYRQGQNLPASTSLSVLSTTSKTADNSKTTAVVVLGQ